MKAEAFVDQLRSWFLRPRIVHRLPGRMRLRVPALKQIDHAQCEWAFVWRDLLGGTAEIETVEVNLTTGSMLIRYHPDQLTETELLAFLRAVNRLALWNWDRLAATPPEELPDVLRRLVCAIRAGIRHRLVLDDKLEISTDVWA
jgi:Heavy metal associated domain 2